MGAERHKEEDVISTVGPYFEEILSKAVRVLKIHMQHTVLTLSVPKRIITGQSMQNFSPY